MTTQTKRSILLFAALGAAAFGTQAACKAVVCGSGTVEQNGECTAEGTAPGGTCGSGTVYDKSSGKCVPQQFICDGGPCGICGANTQLTFDDAGVAYCEGTGGTGCSRNCKTPPPGKFEVCGFLYDVGTGAPIVGADATGINVLGYDALGFANNPGGTPPLDSHPADECGWYEFTVTPPFTGFVASATDDPMGGSDTYALTGVATPATAGQRITLNTYVTTHTQDMAWTTSANLSGGTFSEQGVFLPIYLDGAKPDVAPPLDGTPVSGVKIVENGVTNAANDYYFGDAMAGTRTTINPTLDATGTDGSGLYINGSLTMYSGQGGETSGCMWSPVLAATIPGVIFISEKHLQCM
jgi:hypothetical protein